MAKELAANMEISLGVGRPKRFAAHHIIPPGYNDAAGNATALRKLLADHDIHLNEAANGIYMPHFHDAAEAFPSLGPLHNTLHTDLMMARLRTRLEAIQNPDRVKIVDELAKIANDIIDKSLTPN